VPGPDFIRAAIAAISPNSPSSPMLGAPVFSLVAPLPSMFPVPMPASRQIRVIAPWDGCWALR